MTDGKPTKAIGLCCPPSSRMAIADMKALVDKIHAQGFRAQLWWAPLAAKPDSDVVKNHPEQLLLNADGSKQKISYWNDWYFCPADPAAIEYHRQLVIKMFRDWGYDGLKLDGQHMNAVPPCYNPAHKHARPGGIRRGAARVLQDDLRYGAQHQAGCAGGVLPLRHGLQLLTLSPTSI